MKKLLLALLLSPTMAFASGIYNPGSGTGGGGGGTSLETIFDGGRSSPTATLKGKVGDFTGSVTGSTMTISLSTNVARLDQNQTWYQPQNFSTITVNSPPAGAPGRLVVEGDISIGQNSFTPDAGINFYGFTGAPAGGSIRGTAVVPSGIRFLDNIGTERVRVITTGGMGPLGMAIYSTGTVRFYDGDNSNYVGLKSSSSVNSDTVWSLPDADGTAGQALVTSGNKELYFKTITGGGGSSLPLPAGATNYIQNGSTYQSGAAFNVLNGTVINMATISTITLSGEFRDPDGSRNFKISDINDRGQIYIGREAGLNNTTGTNNTFVGTQAGRNGANQSANTYFGSSAGAFGASGSNNNSFFGQGAGDNVGSAAQNTCIGSQCMYWTNFGNDNTCGGYQSCYNISTANNTAYGSGSCYTTNTGSADTCIGKNADVASESISKAIAIGYNAKAPASNTAKIGGENADSVMVLMSSMTVSSATVTALTIKGLPSQNCIGTDASGKLGSGTCTGGGGGGLPLPAGDTSYIRNTDILQSGATAFPDFLQVGSSSTLNGPVRIYHNNTFSDNPYGIYLYKFTNFLSSPGYGIYAEDHSNAESYGGYFSAAGASNKDNYGVYGTAQGTSGGKAGVFGKMSQNDGSAVGVKGEAASNKNVGPGNQLNYGLYGIADGTQGQNYAAYLSATNGNANFALYAADGQSQFQSSVTVNSDMRVTGNVTLAGLTNQSCVGTSSTGQIQAGTCTGGGGGASSLAVAAGVVRSSPTSDIMMAASQFTGATSGSTITITLDGSSVTLQGNGIYIANVALATGTINSDLQGFKSITLSSFTQVGITTGTVNSDLQAWKSITLSSFTQVGVTTGTLRTDLTSTGVSTGSINSDLQAWKAIDRSTYTAIGLTTGTINADLQQWKSITMSSVTAIGLTTGTINADLQQWKSITISSIVAVGLTTGTINADLQGWKSITRSSFTQVGIATGTINTIVAGHTLSLTTAAYTNAANTFTSSQTITAPGGLAVTFGVIAGSISVNGTGGGTFDATEGTAPSGVASHDLLYADSTAHWLKMINNNGSAYTVVGSSTSSNAGKCAQFSADGSLIAANAACGTGTASGGASTLAVFDEGLQISSPTAILNFVGAGVTATLTGGATATITINGGAASAAGNEGNVQVNRANAIGSASGFNVWSSSVVISTGMYTTYMSTAVVDSSFTINNVANIIFKNSGFVLSTMTTPTSTFQEGQFWNDTAKDGIEYYTSNSTQSIVGTFYTVKQSSANASSTNSINIIPPPGTLETDTIPANFWQTGKMIYGVMSGTFTITSTPLITPRILLGTTVVASTGVVSGVATANANIWKLEFWMTCRSTGATGQIWTYGTLHLANTRTTFEDIPLLFQNATVDTTASQKIQFEWKWGTSNAANYVSLDSGFLMVMH